MKRYLIMIAAALLLSGSAMGAAAGKGTMKALFYRQAEEGKTVSLESRYAGFAEIREGKLVVEVDDADFAEFLNSVAYRKGGKAREIVSSTGKRITTGGFQRLEPGTAEHFKHVVERAGRYGFESRVIPEEKQ